MLVLEVLTFLATAFYLLQILKSHPEILTGLHASDTQCFSGKETAFSENKLSLPADVCVSRQKTC